MAYSPTFTFNNGDVLTEAKTEGNLQDLQEYHNTGVVSGDLSTLEWVDTQHIMPGYYHSVSNTMSFVSGFCGGRIKTIPTDVYTYLNRKNTHTVGTGDLDPNQQYAIMPHGSVQFTLPRAAGCVLVSWFGYHIHEDYADDAIGQSVVELVLTQDSMLSDRTFPANLGSHTYGTPTTSGRYRPSMSWTCEEDFLTSGADSVESAAKLLRAPNAGFLLLNSNIDSGVWRVALVGQTNSSVVKWLHWTVSVEAWI